MPSKLLSEIEFDKTSTLGLNMLKRKEPILKNLMLRIGPFKPKFLDPSIKSLYHIIISQSLSKEVAKTIADRFDILVNGDYSSRKILSMSNSSFWKIGLSKQKTRTIKETSKLEKIIIDFSRFQDLEISNILTEIKGIGPWTAQMFLIFCLRRLDIFPTNDIWLAKSIQKEFRLQKLPDSKKLENIGCRWKPYRTIAAWYFWKGYYPDSLI